MIDTIILIFILSASNILAFYLGARLSQKVVRNEEIKLPNPVNIVKEIEHKKEQKKEAQRIEKVYANIDSYDGTNTGQLPIE